MQHCLPWLTYIESVVCLFKNEIVFLLGLCLLVSETQSCSCTGFEGFAVKPPFLINHIIIIDVVEHEGSQQYIHSITFFSVASVKNAIENYVKENGNV